ncbi:hypothetical protein SAMN03084138_02067 [Enterovibrio norvegicus DSM 15893]|uniref:Uncharacterized protein n=1 Tax=Enterovibrio norvegicus DSM 15893 TaxID=1121869 RepID=A0A1I5PWF9_9GAMM|nr:hypothetical protein SAMN03084138_02067 [Enterovibrio norvegicus DSM 15893]
MQDAKEPAISGELTVKKCRTAASTSRLLLIKHCFLPVCSLPSIAISSGSGFGYEEYDSK